MCTVGGHFVKLYQRLSRIQDLTLASAKLERFPDGVSRLTRLTRLDVSDHQLEGISSGLSNLTRLESLDLSTSPAGWWAPRMASKMGNCRTSAHGTHMLVLHRTTLHKLTIEVHQAQQM